MAAYTRKQYSGAARNTTTTTLLTDIGTSVNIAATTGWPSIEGIPFYVVIQPSTNYEEKCLATISGSTLTLVRAQDDTTAFQHPIGSTIYPVFTANDADEANELVSKLTTAGDLLTTDGTNLLRLGVGPNGYFLKASSSASAGIEWASIPTINSLDDIGDVTIASVEDGDFLVYSNSASAWVNDTIHFITVSDTAPNDEVAEGDLWYNSLELELYTYYSGSWVQVTFADQGTPELYELTDVAIDDPLSGETLVYNGTEWENTIPPSALSLETARTISLSGDVTGSVSFDGSQDVDISTIIQLNSITLGVDTNGNYMSDIYASNGIAIAHTPGEGSSASVTLIAQLNNLADVIAPSPSDGNFLKYVSASSSWIPAAIPTINNLDDIGDVSASAAASGDFLKWNGLAWVNDPINLGTDTIGNYVTDVTAGTGVNVTHTPGEGSTASISIGQNVGTSSSVTFAQVTAPLTGNASTASALQTARTIALTGDVAGSASFDGSASVAISATIQPNSVALGTDTTGNYVLDVAGGTGIIVTHTPGEGSTASVSLNASVDNLADTVITNPLINQSLVYDGTNWINQYAAVTTYARNADATALNVGEVVYLFGAAGDRASVRRASNTSDTTSSKTVGVVEIGGAPGADVTIVTQGYVSGINLGAYNAGDVLWLGSTAGTFTTTKPSAPNHLVFIGVVARANSGNGIMYVKCQNGYELDELHDVAISGLASGDFLKYNGSTWVNDPINLGTDTTGDYVSSLVAGTGITLSNNSGEGATPTIAIGQNVATSSSVTFARVTIQGNLDVQGTITRVNETNLELADSFIYLNATSASVNPDFGFAANYYDGTYKHAGVFRDASDGVFKVFDGYTPEPQNPINVSDASYNDASLQAKRFVSTQTNGTAPLSVSSSTVVTNLNADKLDGQDGSYYAPLNSPTFTGTVTLPNNTVALGTQTTGNYVSDLSGGTGVTVVHTPGEGSTPVVSIGQAVETSASVAFAAVTAPLIGNASTATTLQTTRTINLGGDLSGSASFNGSSDITITATVQANSVALGVDTTGNYMSDISSGTGITISHTPSEGSTATVSISDSTISTKTNNYTLALIDKRTIVEMNVGSANTVTVPPNSDVAFPTGSEITIFQYGAGKTQILAGSGVTIRSTPGNYLRAQYAVATLVKRGTNEWILFGDLSAS
jgi:hypothetical protein